MPVNASPTSITLLSLSLFPHWSPFHFTLWSLAGHIRLFWAHWQFTVVYERPKNRKWGSSLCCKLTTAVWDLPAKTLNPCTTSSPQTPWNLPPQTTPPPPLRPFIFFPTNQTFSPSYPLHKSPLKLPCPYTVPMRVNYFLPCCSPWLPCSLSHSALSTPCLPNSAMQGFSNYKIWGLRWKALESASVIIFSCNLTTWSPSSFCILACNIWHLLSTIHKAHLRLIRMSFGLQVFCHKTKCWRNWNFKLIMVLFEKSENYQSQ